MGKVIESTIGDISKGGKEAISSFTNSIVGISDEARKYITEYVEKATKATTTAVKDTTKTATKAATQTVKTTTNAVKDTGKAIEKGAEVTGKAVVKGAETAVNKGIEVGKNLADSSMGAIKSVAKGDIAGALKNAGNVASFGTVDLTGKNKGILNINTDKYLAKLMGVKPMGDSGTGSVTAVVPSTYKQAKKGLLTQLRQGKGLIGGGSYTTVAKNPLGGKSGITGK